MYLETVDSAISKPSFSSSPWMRGAPLILLAHSSNEFPQLTVDFGPARLTARFPAPIGPKPGSMPAQNCVRLNNPGHNEQAWPSPSHPHQQRSVTPTQPQTMRCPPQGNIELMSQEEILDFKPSARPEQVDDKLPKQMEDGKHRGIMR